MGLRYTLSRCVLVAMVVSRISQSGKRAAGKNRTKGSHDSHQRKVSQSSTYPRGVTIILIIIIIIVIIIIITIIIIIIIIILIILIGTVLLRTAGQAKFIKQDWLLASLIIIRFWFSISLVC